MQFGSRIIAVLRTHIVYLLIFAMVAVVLALPTNAISRKLSPPTGQHSFHLGQPTPATLADNTYHLMLVPGLDPNDPAIHQLEPGHPNSVSAAPFTTRGQTVYVTRFFGLYVEIVACGLLGVDCYLRVKVILYRDVTHLLLAVWEPPGWIGTQCFDGCDNFYGMQNLMLSALPAIPAKERYCWGSFCVTVYPQDEWVNAVLKRPNDLKSALFDTSWYGDCLTLVEPRTNWTITVYPTNGCRKGY